MVVRLHEVIDGEVILAVIEPGATADDLLEFDHGIDGAHEHDVADVPGVNAGGEFLGRGQDGGDGLLVVLEVPEMLLSQGAVIRRYPLAVVRGGAGGLDLVDEVTHRKGMILGCAEHQCLFPLVDLRHEDFNPLLLPFPDFDDLVEVRFLVPFTRLDLTFNDLVVWGVNLVIKSGGNLLHPERSQIPVIDPILQRIDINRFPEIGIGVGVVLAFRSGCQS